MTAKPTSFDELKLSVEEAENVRTVSMADLRDIYGVKRLGIHVCAEIENKLAGVGLGHSPSLEPDAWQRVRLYKLGTPVGDVLAAADRPGEDGDKTLRKAVDNNASEVLREIRALVCE